MAPVAIITDMTAHLGADFVPQPLVTVMPVEFRYGDDRFVIGPGDDKTRFFELLSAGPAKPASATVGQEAFEDALEDLSRATEDILIITSSGKLSGAYANARLAARGFMGRCRVTVMDSLSTSWALGLVVKKAAEASAQGRSLDAIVRLVRGLLPHLYAVFFVERLDYLEQGGRIGVAQAVLGTMLRIKPVLLLEEGDVVPLEKMRTRVTAIEKLSDFVEEFARVQDIVILRSPLNGTASDKVAQLTGHLSEILPTHSYPVIQYDPVLACHLGPEAVGVTVFEGV